MEQQEQTTRDPQRLQTLLSSLTAFNGRYASASDRWKVRDELAPEIYRDADGNRIVKTARVAYVEPLLRRQYEMLVAERHMRLTAIDGRVLGLCVRFLTDEGTPTCLLLFGTPGTGKTTFMKAMYRVLMFLYGEEAGDGSVHIKYVKASDLGYLLKNDKEEYKKVKGATCLFIDDLGFAGEGEMVNDYGVRARPVEDIIEHRYDRQLMTVCTTNLTEREIRERYGERVYSRVCEMFWMVAVTGTDWRRVR